MSDEPAPRPPLTDADVAFLRALADIPEDRNTWLVYADWLEDRGDPRAEFVRLVVARDALAEGHPDRAAADARLAALRAELDPRWLAAFDPAPVVACPSRGMTPCGQTWTGLHPTDAPDIRVCRECRRPVFYAVDAGEAELFAAAGEAVALSTRVPPDQNPFREPPLPDDEYDEIEVDVATFLGGPAAVFVPPPPDSPEPPRPWWKFW